MFTEDTIVRDVIVDGITMTGSAFGVTSAGDGVFINTRIVNAMKIKSGDHLRAYIVPNYEDKRDAVKYRALRVDVVHSMFEGQAPDAQDPEPKVASQKVLQMLETHGPLRTSVLARLVGLDTGEVGVICQGLFGSGKIAMADVFNEPNQKRASHRVWGLNINEFDVDPFDDADDD